MMDADSLQRATRIAKTSGTMGYRDEGTGGGDWRNAGSDQRTGRRHDGALARAHAEGGQK